MNNSGKDTERRIKSLENNLEIVEFKDAIITDSITKAICLIEKFYDPKNNVMLHYFDRDNLKELYEILTKSI